MKTRVSLSLLAAASLAANSFGQIVFQYDRADSGTNFFHGISYSSYNDVNEAKGGSDFSIKGTGATSDRSGCVHWAKMQSWLQANPGISITSAQVITGCDPALVAAGTMNVKAVLYDMTTNLMFWPAQGVTGCETAVWLDWNYALGTAILTAPSPTVGATKDLTITIAALQATPVTFDVTELMQYAALHTDLPYGFVFVTTGGGSVAAPVRINGFGAEDYPNGDNAQTLASENIALNITCTNCSNVPGANALETPVAASANRMLSAQPNPFTSSTNLRFSLTNGTHQVLAAIYGVDGKLVKSLFTGSLNGGSHSLVWNGSGAANGVYLFNLKVDGKIMNRKVMLAR